MFLTMKAPANRDKGQRTVRCTEVQANILRKVGWTEVQQPKAMTHTIPLVTTVAAHYLAEDGMGSPPDQTLEPDPVEDPDTVRVSKPKRTYHRRVVNVEPDGKVNYSIKPPKRRYRRRDMTAEE